MDKPLTSAIAAIGAKDRAIGADNNLLWHIPEDMKRFRDLTMGHPIIMGRKTYESLPDKFRPLPGRENIVVTRDESYEAPGAHVVNSLDKAMELAKTLDDEEIFIGGGGQIYEKALPFTDRLYLTIVESDKTCDVFFPDYEEQFRKEIFREKKEHEGLKYTWIDLER